MMYHALSHWLVGTATLLIHTSPPQWVGRSKDRLLCILLLWLVASLSSSQQPTAAPTAILQFWENLLFFACVLEMVLTHHPPQQQQQQQQQRRISFWTKPLVVSAWSALTMEVLLGLTDTEALQHATLSVFGLAYAMRLVSGRRRHSSWFPSSRTESTLGSLKPQSTMATINGVSYHPHQNDSETAVAGGGGGPDSKDWPQWTEAQVLEWLLTTCNDSSSSNHNLSNVPLELASVLPGQGVSGRTLPHVTTTMLQAMGLSLGTAVDVQFHISRLTQTATAATSATLPLSSSSWLDQHDAEYNHHPGQQQQQTGVRPASTPPPAGLGIAFGAAENDTADASNQEEAARTLMRQRFGLELPEIAREDPPTPPPARAGVATTPSSSTAPSSLSDFSHTSLPPGLLENMPANLAEIARRKPDLVHKILASRRHRQEQASLQTAATAMTTTTRDHTLPTWQEEEQQQRDDEAYDDEEEQMEHDHSEWTQLLVKRNNGDLRYRSIS